MLIILNVVAVMFGWFGRVAGRDIAKMRLAHRIVRLVGHDQPVKVLNRGRR
jgi:hypothetical protein